MTLISVPSLSLARFAGLASKLLIITGFCLLPISKLFASWLLGVAAILFLLGYLDGVHLGGLKGYWIFFGVFFACLSVSTALLPWEKAGVGFGVYWRYAEYLVLFWASSELFKSPAWRERLENFFLAGMALVCASGLWQMLSVSGLDPLSGIPIDLPGRTDRMSGPLSSPNGLAAFLLAAIPLSAQKWLSQKRWNPKAAAYVALLTLFFICFLSTRSRAGLAGLIAGILLYFLASRAWRPLLLASATTLILFLAFASTRLNFLTFFDLSDITISHRLDYWKLSWEIILKYPFFGAGPGIFYDTLLVRDPALAALSGFHAHNSFLELASEIGLPGALALISGIGWVWLGSRPQKAGTDQSADLIFWVRIAVPALLTQAFFDIHFQSNQFSLLFWILLGLLGSFWAGRLVIPHHSAGYASFRRSLGLGIGVLLFIGLASLPFYRPAWASFFLARASYFLIAAMWLGWAWSFKGMIQGYSRLYLPKIHRFSLAGILILCGLIFIVVRPQLRVLEDEAHLLAVSRSMAVEARADKVTQGYWEGGRFVAMERQNDIRPYNYPFFVHGLHRLFGFTAENAYRTNFIFLSLILFGVYLTAAHWTRSAFWGWSTVLAVLAQPVVLLSASSGGMELSQIFWIGAAMAVFLYADQKRSDGCFLFAWMSLVMLAHTRYEAPLFFMAVAGGLFLLRAAPVRSGYHSAWIVLTPFFFLPLIWQRVLFIGYHPPSALPGAPLWSAGHFVENLSLFVRALWVWPPAFPFNPLVNALGLFGMGYGFFYFQKQRALSKSAKKIIFLFISAGLVQITALTSYFESELSRMSSERYFLMGAVALSLAAAAVLWRFRKYVSKELALVLFLALFALGLASASHVRLAEEERISIQVSRFIERQEKNTRDVVIVSARPIVYLANGFGSFSFDDVSAARHRGVFWNREKLIYAVCLQSEWSDRENKLKTLGIQGEIILRLSIPSSSPWVIARLQERS